jgi:hypothetical protein
MRFALKEDAKKENHQVIFKRIMALNAQHQSHSGIRAFYTLWKVDVIGCPTCEELF